VFDKQDELEFLEHEQKENIPYIRGMFLVFIFLYSFFALADVLYYPTQWQTLFIIRFAIVVPVFILIIFLSFYKRIFKFHQYYVAFSFFVGGAGIAYMLILHPENIVYYGGLFMVYFSGYLLSRLRFRYAAVAGISVLLFHLISHSLIIGSFSETFLFGMLFYIGANLIGIVGSYQFEMKNRKQFSNDKEIEKVSNELRREYNEKVEQFKQLEQSIHENKELIAKNEELDCLTKSLKESERRFKVLHDASFGGIAIHDKGRILDCNQGLSDLTGYSLDELIGMDGLLLIASEHRDFVMNKILTGLEIPYESYGIRKNNEIFPVRIEARNVPYQGKEVRVTEFRDITDIKEAQNQLLETLKHQKLILDSTSSGLYMIDNNDLCIYVNENTVKLLGYESEEEILGKKMHELIHHSYEDGSFYPADKCKLLSKIKLKSLSGEEDIIWRKDGTFFHVSYSSTPQIENGALIGVVVTFFDITNRVWLERQRIEKQKALEESEEQYRLLTSQMQLGLALHEIICDDRGQPIDYRFVSVNHAFEQLTGLEANKIIGKTVKEVLPETEDYWIEVYGEVVLTQKPVRYENYSKATGKYFRVSAYSTKEGYFATVFDDVTEQKNIEQAKDYLRTHDPLTGLTNRLYFDQQIGILNKKENLPISVINFDINGLIIINEAFGHEYGNQFIKFVASLFKDVFEEDSVISRVGGDQFAIILKNTNEEDAKEKAIEVLSSAYDYEIEGTKLSIAYGVATKTKADEDIEKLFRISENAMYSNKIFESQSYRNQSIQSIIKALHEKNPREEEHSYRVSSLCEKFGKALSMGYDDINKLRSISYLHDIGKISIDEAILNKPGKLTEEEWEIVKKHPEIGARIISTSDSLSVIADDILLHHERFDGKGYPKGVSGKDIPIRARMIAIIDSYDAMTSDRPYSKALSQDETVKELYRCSGTQFDAELVDVFVKEVLAFED